MATCCATMVLHCARASFPMHPLASSDYVGGTFTVVIPANMAMANLSISTIKTDLVEADKDFKATLSAPGSDSVVFERETAFLTIMDRTGEYAVYRLRWLLHRASCCATHNCRSVALLLPSGTV